MTDGKRHFPQPRKFHGTRFTDKHLKDRKTPVVGLLSRDGKVRPRVLADVNGENLKAIIAQHVAAGSRIMTDESRVYSYLSEYQFRFNNRDLTDGERAVAAIKAAQGKRLTYAEQVDG